MNARKAHKIWLGHLRGRDYRPATSMAALAKAKSWWIRSSRRNGTHAYVEAGHFTENDRNTYARLRRRRAVEVSGP